MRVHIEEPTRRRDGTWAMLLTSRADLGAVYDELHDKDLNCELKVFRQKRSLDANRYAWVLIDKLAEKLNIPPKEIYREAIRNIGGVSITGCYREKDAPKIIRMWGRNGIGWIAEVLDKRPNAEGCVNMRFYYGSSEYDTAQMSRLIDIIVQDCKEQGIETMTPAELQAIKDRWGEC